MPKAPSEKPGALQPLSWFLIELLANAFILGVMAGALVATKLGPVTLPLAVILAASSLTALFLHGRPCLKVLEGWEEMDKSLVQAAKHHAELHEYLQKAEEVVRAANLNVRFERSMALDAVLNAGKAINPGRERRKR